MTKGCAIANVHGPQSHEQRDFQQTPTPRRSRTTLRTLHDVASELARLYRRAERGQIPTADASRLAYILTSLGKVIEASAIEARLTALEAIANENR